MAWGFQGFLGLRFLGFGVSNVCVVVFFNGGFQGLGF